MEDEKKEEELFSFNMSDSLFRFYKKDSCRGTLYIIEEVLGDDTEVFSAELHSKVGIRLATILRRIAANG